ncbi:MULTISPECIES: hypothetical protein [Aphanothece]|uniref:hypothetical protein n=1 Tax=Aphanothece TaxID=1121 RepID=UPI003984A500
MTPRARFLPALLTALALGMAGASARAQDLVGCALVEGQLSCVPGVSADPQAQIRALRREISGTLELESGVQQTIDGLESLVVEGELTEGSLLSVRATGTLLAALPPSAFHWYRLLPGSSHWLLIAGASGPSYNLRSADVGSQLMVVVATATGAGTGSRRQVSPPVGPIGR